MPLTVHFLNVNRGDCSIIEFPSGHIGMIDICDVGFLDPDTRKELLAYISSAERLGLDWRGNTVAEQEKYARRVAAPTTDPVEYFLDRFRYQGLFRLLVTHPHMDHLSGLDRLCANVTPVNFWHTGFDNFDLDTTDWTMGPYRKEDWVRYKALRASASDPKALVKHRYATGEYWSDDGIEIWSPTPALVATAVAKNDPNILSQVVRLSYRGWHFVFGADASAVHTWPDIYPWFDLSGPTVLKASHHGRNSGYYQPAVKEMAPWLTITSVGDKNHDATEKYRQYSDHTVSLRFSGTFSLTVTDDGVLHWPTALQEHWKLKK